MTALEAGIRFYRWLPPRDKRCPHTPGCSELALAAVQAGQGLDEVLRIVSTCNPEGKSKLRATPVTLPLLVMWALFPFLMGGTNMSPCAGVSVSKQWGSKGGTPCVKHSAPGWSGPECVGIGPSVGCDAPDPPTFCIGVNSLNPPCGK